MAMMHDEQLAIIFKSVDCNDNASASHSYRTPSSQNETDEMDENTAEHPQIEQEGVTYLELQMYSQELAAHLYHRFGVRRGDAVAIFCHGHAAAEVASILTIVYPVKLLITLLLSLLSIRILGMVELMIAISYGNND